jgi:FkbM family methyltransferase
MASFLSYPEYVLSSEEKKNLGFISKLYFLIISIITIIIEKYTNYKLFTVLINLILQKEVKLSYFDGFYSANQNDLIFYYPNKRVTRMLNGIEEQSEKIFKEYSLDKIIFEEGDLIIDCGANVGELYLHLAKIMPYFHYFAFEPDPVVFECLKKNIPSKASSLKSEALSDTTQEKNFFILSENADSSLEYSGNGEKVTINTVRLDDLEYMNIKLLKIDAEGHELETLMGAKRTLKTIEYISVDFGPEKGINFERTLPQVSDYLYENNFKMLYANSPRDTGLFINKDFLK